MKHKLLMIVLALPFACFAQNDSSITYKSKDGKLTTKDSAFIYSVRTKHDSLWHVVTYFNSTNKLQSEGYYIDYELLKPVGKFNNYMEDGTLNNTCNYTNGQVTDKTYYFKNGNKKSFIAYSSNGISNQKGWDENGKEIPGYITEQEASFNGSWTKYLERNLNPGIAAASGMPPGVYMVTVAFTINTDGSVINVKIDSDAGNCSACVAEAFNVISGSPAWRPAILNNEPVMYRQKQNISFQVIEDKKRRKN